MITIEEAIQLACSAHETHVDKIGEPYIFHPIRVMLSVNSENAKIVAILHDVLEDTNLLSENLSEAGISKECLHAIQVLTKTKGESYKEYLQKVKYNALAREVKIADIRDNSSPIRLYRLEPETVLRLTKKYIEAIKYLEAEGGK